MDNNLALKIYIKARATPKVVAAFAERREFDKILIYSKQVSHTIVDAVSIFSPYFFLSILRVKSEFYLVIGWEIINYLFSISWIM